MHGPRSAVRDGIAAAARTTTIDPQLGDAHMLKHCLGWFLATVALVALALPAFGADDEGVSLFDGKSLKGWTQKNGDAKYRVEDGTIVGTTGKGNANSFLCTDKDYGDFDLTFEVKVDDPLNSGVQFRSQSTKDYQDGRVHGPQVEIAVGGEAGRVYGEALPNAAWMCAEGNAAAKAAFKAGEWNQYRVRAVGKKIETWVNGVPVASFEDEKSKMPSGFIGLQVHAIGEGEGPYQVRWRNIKIKDLSKK
jgi:hypothetical protein